MTLENRLKKIFWTNVENVIKSEINTALKTRQHKATQTCEYGVNVSGKTQYCKQLKEQGDYCKEHAKALKKMGVEL